MRAAVLFSGGKDSTMAAYKACEDGWDVDYLVSMHSKNPHSYMFHVPNIHLTHILSQAMEIPLLTGETQGHKEKELEDLEKILSKLVENDIEAVFTGALASSYQKSRIDSICQELGLQSHAPLWHRNPQEYMEELLTLGFEVIITQVAAEGLDESWLGRKIDIQAMEELLDLHSKYGLHLAFEGGEAETLVLNCPLFKRRLKITDSQKIWEKDSGYMIIKDAVLVEKG